MSILETVTSLLASKVVAGTAAAGLAIAGTAGLTNAIERTTDAEANETAIARLNELAGDEVGLEDETPEADSVADADAETAADVDAASTEAELVAAEEDDEVTTEDDEDGNGRAAEVHAVLGGGEATPEDGAAFGEAVSTQARDQEQGSFGREVAAAASRGASERGAEEEADESPEASTEDAEDAEEAPAERSSAADRGHDRAAEARADDADRPAGERGRK